jgi:hypothetical protein
MPQKTVYGTHKGNATQSDIIAAENGNAFYVLVSYVIPGTGGSGIVRNTLCAVANPTPPNQFTGFEFLAGKQYTFRLLLDSESNLIQIGTVTVTDMEDDTNVIDPINPQP